MTQTRVIKRLIVIGSSTGGPRALYRIIPNIPENVPAAFLVVQHMPPKFTASLAERLNEVSRLKVKEAEHGEAVRCGYVYIAPGGRHLKVKGETLASLCLELSDDEPVAGHRPSVDVLFESIGRSNISGVIAVILTGMGSDGSNYLVDIKKKEENRVIIQDEDSCVVFGMPGAALKTGMVDKVVPLDKMAEEIMNMLGVQYDGREPVS